MIYCAISDKDEKFYTDVYKMFEKMGDFQTQYNWLLSDVQITASRTHETLDLLERNKHVWLSGEEMTKISEDVAQWIWAVLSAFDKSVIEEDALKYPLPFADENRELWELPLKMQNPLAKAEIIPFDSSYVLFRTTEKLLYEKFREAYPLSKDLAKWLERIEKNHN